jgi:aminotransferase class III
LFVVDDVITGFGRTGEWFACDRFDLQPGILLLAKGITSGYLPLRAAAISRRVWEPFWRGGSESVMRITYSGHASACAAALKIIEILRTERLVENVAALERDFTETIQALVRAPLVKEVRAGVGFLAGVELEDAASAERVARVALDHGLLLRVIARTTLQVSPPVLQTGETSCRLSLPLQNAAGKVAKELGRETVLQHERELLHAVRDLLDLFLVRAQAELLEQCLHRMTTGPATWDDRDRVLAHEVGEVGRETDLPELAVTHLRHHVHDDSALHLEQVGADDRGVGRDGPLGDFGDHAGDADDAAELYAGIDAEQVLQPDGHLLGGDVSGSLT